MTRLLPALLLLLAQTPALQANPPNNTAHWDAATRALQNGLPTVALGHILSVQPQSKSLTIEQKLIYGLASLLSGNPLTTLQILNPPPNTTLSPAEHLLRGHALLSINRPQDAATEYSAAKTNTPLFTKAALCQARALICANLLPEAKAILQPLANPSNPRAQLDLASLLITQNNPLQAIKTLQQTQPTQLSEQAEHDYLLALAKYQTGDFQFTIQTLSQVKNFPAQVATHAIILLAAAQAASDDLAKAEDVLEEFINSYGRAPNLPKAFAALDQIYNAQESPSNSMLRKWRKDQSHPLRASLAYYYSALNELRLQRPQRALDDFLSFLHLNPNDLLADQARWHASQILISLNNPQKALQILNNQNSPLAHFARGTVLAHLKNYQEAAASFRASQNHIPEAAFNAQLCEIMQSPLPTHQIPPNEDPELTFARAIWLAKSRSFDSAHTLESITHSAPEPWASAAAFTLAELACQSLDFPSAKRHLHRVSNHTLVPESSHAAILVFIEDDGSLDAAPRVESLARRFLSQFPNSPQRADVTLKLAEVLYRKGDFFAARTEFQNAAAEAPGTSLAEHARFMAAQAAAKTMDPTAMEEALEIYDAVARLGSTMAPRARLSQALLLNALRRPKEAITVLDDLIASNSDPEITSAAIIEKGDTLFNMEPPDPQNTLLAISAWTPLTNPETPSRWRNQAACKIGIAQASLGNTEAALASFSLAFSHPPKDEPEYFWYYKAGFEAGRILEEKERFSEAIAVYHLLAKGDGPRASEAKDKITRLRLENMIWEE